jgi:hypothetical protein
MVQITQAASKRSAASVAPSERKLRVPAPPVAVLLAKTATTYRFAAPCGLADGDITMYAIPVVIVRMTFD